ncbi:MAG: flippase-like domain-containing protein [Lewinellaceae bacterium]|nr:flippase-like domain-containing protein [Lewinellaceae bacterium]
MTGDAQRIPFNINVLLRRMLPVICVGVAGNLLFSWYTADKGKWLDWSQCSAAYLLLAALLSLLPWFWHCVRLAIWGRFFGVKISSRNLLRIAVATDVGGSIAPQAIGGAPVKITMLVQQGYTPGKATLLTLLSGVEDVIFFAMAIPVSLVLIQPWNNPLWQHAGWFMKKNGFAVLLTMLLLFSVYLLFRKMRRSGQIGKNRSPRWHRWVADFKSTVHLIYTQGRKPFLLSVLALVAQWLTRFSILLSVLLALGLPHQLLHFFLLQWMVFVAMVFVPTPGAAGGAEAAFLLVFGKIIPQTAVGTVLAGWRFLTYYFMLLTGVVILWLLRERAVGPAEMQAEPAQPKCPDT